MHATTHTRGTPFRGPVGTREYRQRGGRELAGDPSPEEEGDTEGGCSLVSLNPGDD